MTIQEITNTILSLHRVATKCEIRRINGDTESGYFSVGVYITKPTKDPYKELVESYNYSFTNNIIDTDNISYIGSITKKHKRHG